MAKVTSVLDHTWFTELSDKGTFSLAIYTTSHHTKMHKSTSALVHEKQW